MVISLSGKGRAPNFADRKATIDFLPSPPLQDSLAEPAISGWCTHTLDCHDVGLVEVYEWHLGQVCEV